MIIIRYLILLFFLSPIYCFGQVVEFQPSDFYNLHIEENQWTDGSNYFANSKRIVLNKVKTYYYDGTDFVPSVSLHKKLNVYILGFQLDTVSNEVKLKGYIEGGWYGLLSAVRICVGVPLEIKNDTFWVRPNGINVISINGIQISKPHPLYTIEVVDIEERYRFQIPVGQKHKSENSHFNISFIVTDEDIIVFGLRSGCYTEIFDIGGILDKKRFKYKKW